MYLLAEKRPSLRELSLLRYISNGKKVQLKLINEILPHWQAVALSLDFSAARIANIEKSHIMDPIGAAYTILTQWMGSDPQHCWAKLISALREASDELHVVAHDLEQALIGDVEGIEGKTTTGTLECMFTNTLLLSHYLHFMYSLETGVHTEFRVLGGGGGEGGGRGYLHFLPLCLLHIRESVDSLCRNGTGPPIVCVYWKAVLTREHSFPKPLWTPSYPI